MLCGIAQLRGHRDTIGSRHERVRQIHTDRPLMVVAKQESMRAVCLRSHVDNRLDSNRAFAAPELVQLGKCRPGRARVNATAIDGDLNGAEHFRDVAFAFLSGEHAVAVPIDGGEYGVGNRRTRRQEELEIHTIGFHANARRLQVFIEPMRRRPLTGGRDQRRNKDDGRGITSLQT